MLEVILLHIANHIVMAGIFVKPLLSPLCQGHKNAPFHERNSRTRPCPFPHYCELGLLISCKGGQGKIFGGSVPLE